MDKKALAKIPLRDASPEAISQAKRIETVKTYIAAEVVNCGGKRILLLNLYLQSDLKKGITGAAYRVFLDKDDYITQDMKSKGVKWLTGRIYAILNCWHVKQTCACVDDVSYKTIENYLGGGLHPFTTLEKCQDAIIQKRLAAKHKKITDSIDAKMDLIPALPVDWQEWLEKTVLPASRYIFYDYQKGKSIQKGRCTYCNASVEVEQPRYGKEGVCPKCGTKVTFKSCKKAGQTLPDWGQAAIIQRVGGDVVLRSFQIRRYHYPQDRKRSKTEAQEVSRDFFGPNKTVVYEWRKFLSTQNIRWTEGGQAYYLHHPTVYPIGISEALKGTVWQYSALDQFVNRRTDATTNLYRFLEDFRKKPYIEYLVKLRLYRLVEELTERTSYVRHLNEKGDTFLEILGVGKQYLTLLQEIDAADVDISLVQAASKAGYMLTAQEYRAFVDKHGHNTTLFKMTCYATLHRITRYLDEQAPPENSKQRRNNTFNDFKDYIEYCEELEYDLKNEFVLFPKDLKKAHDIAYKRVLALRKKKQQKRRKELDAKAAEYFVELQERYGWEHLGMVVIAPKSLFEIIKEGQKLHHCVGGYAENAAEGRTVILFLRNKDAPDKPFFTIEIRDNKVVQCRGRNNCGMPEDIEKFIGTFAKKKVTPEVQGKAVGA